jgi:prevent-host-death family protein
MDTLAPQRERLKTVLSLIADCDKEANNYAQEIGKFDSYFHLIYDLARLDRRNVMMYTWQLQEAKNRFSEVVSKAIKSGPQLITRRGAEVAIVLSYAEYRRLVSSQRKLSTFLRESPLTQVSLDLRRDPSDARPEPAL